MYINPSYNFQPAQVDNVPSSIFSHFEKMVECRYTDEGLRNETKRVLNYFLRDVKQDNNFWDVSVVLDLRNELNWNVVRLLILNGFIEMDSIPAKFTLTPKGAEILSSLT
jgi:hypothetical protein